MEKNIVMLFVKHCICVKHTYFKGFLISIQYNQTSFNFFKSNRYSLHAFSFIIDIIVIQVMHFFKLDTFTSSLCLCCIVLLYCCTSLLVNFLFSLETWCEDIFGCNRKLTAEIRDPRANSEVNQPAHKDMLQQMLTQVDTMINRYWATDKQLPEIEELVASMDSRQMDQKNPIYV